jgi:DNA-binding transcriptional MerR regulator
MNTTAEVAKRVGVCKSTLLRWIHEGLMPDVGRDWRGWRMWSEKDINKTKAFMEAYHSKPIRRVRRSSLSRAEFAKAAAQSMGSFAKGYFPRPGGGM